MLEREKRPEKTLPHCCIEGEGGEEDEKAGGGKERYGGDCR